MKHTALQAAAAEEVVAAPVKTVEAAAYRAQLMETRMAAVLAAMAAAAAETAARLGRMEAMVAMVGFTREIRMVRVSMAVEEEAVVERADNPTRLVVRQVIRGIIRRSDAAGRAAAAGT